MFISTSSFSQIFWGLGPRFSKFCVRYCLQATLSLLLTGQVPNARKINFEKFYQSMVVFLFLFFLFIFLIKCRNIWKIMFNNEIKLLCWNFYFGLFMIKLKWNWVFVFASKRLFDGEIKIIIYCCCLVCHYTMHIANIFRFCCVSSWYINQYMFNKNLKIADNIAT